MARERTVVNFEVSPDVMRMIDQRAKQEGISKSDYLRECIYLELVFSGDLEATKFVVKKLGKRVREVLLDKVSGVDLPATLEELAK